jgi:hypothetical protein
MTPVCAQHRRIWLQFPEAEYMDADEVKYRKLYTAKQYLAYLKATSDAERGKSGFHGVAMRGNGRWQSRITGVAVRSWPGSVAPTLPTLHSPLPRPFTP